MCIFAKGPFAFCELSPGGRLPRFRLQQRLTVTGTTGTSDAQKENFPVKTPRIHLIPLILAGSLVALPAVAIAQDAHSHGNAAEMTLSLNKGAKWETDEALRTGMSAIRQTFEAVIADIHGDRLDGAQYAALADGAEAQVNYIVENCKLPEEPDQQLHLVLAHLLEGIEQLRTPGSGLAGTTAVIEALNAYGEHFDHPEWKPIAL